MRKIWSGSVSDLPSSDSRTQPVPSMAAWVVGSARTPNTASADAGMVMVALIVSLLIPIQTAPAAKNNLAIPCQYPEEKVMSLSVFWPRNPGATMESFIHLRKGKTPRRLHADLDGLKDDELGRGGFTGRTANLYRRHDPTAYRADGPLRPIDVLSSELKPSDATDADGGPLLMFSNADCRISLSRRGQP